MAVYEYRCARCGGFDVNLAIGTAPDRRPCPACAGPARRVYSPPMLRQVASRSLAVALDQEDQSRDAPEVVSQVPQRREMRPVQPTTPLIRRTLRP